MATIAKKVLNTAAIVGLGQFKSIFQRIQGGGWGNPSRYPRGYSNTRGILIAREAIRRKELDFSEAYYFQFNPQQVSDVKEALYEIRPYGGLSYNDYIWNGGGERIISFQLFLDNTPQSKTSIFRPTAYNSQEANTIVPESKNSDGSFEFVGEAFSVSRVHERGILPEIEKIQSFLYPAKVGDERTPRFSEGGVISAIQFRPPDVVVLALGPIYLEGFIKSAPITYSLFDSDLTPLRATVDIEFAVTEYAEINREINLEGKVTK